LKKSKLERFAERSFGVVALSTVLVFYFNNRYDVKNEEIQCHTSALIHSFG